MSVDDHGSCVHCGFDLNGGYIYDTFLEKEKNHVSALAVASMYGARKGFGKWGKQIYCKFYEGEGFTNKKRVNVCRSCGKSCYNKEDTKIYIDPIVLQERYSDESSNT